MRKELILKNYPDGLAQTLLKRRRWVLDLYSKKEDITKGKNINRFINMVRKSNTGMYDTSEAIGINQYMVGILSQYLRNIKINSINDLEIIIDYMVDVKDKPNDYPYLYVDNLVTPLLKNSTITFDLLKDLYIIITKEFDYRISQLLKFMLKNYLEETIEFLSEFKSFSEAEFIVLFDFLKKKSMKNVDERIFNKFIDSVPNNMPRRIQLDEIKDPKLKESLAMKYYLISGDDSYLNETFKEFILS